MLSEFGGIAIGRDRERAWGYSRADDGAALGRRYAELLAVRELGMFAGFRGPRRFSDVPMPPAPPPSRPMLPGATNGREAAPPRTGGG